VTGPTPSSSCRLRNQASWSGGVVGEAEQADEVFDVGGFEVADAAVLDERDPPPGEFQFEQVGVVSGAHQDRLLP
jgi:hypothetical protein